MPKNSRLNEDQIPQGGVQDWIKENWRFVKCSASTASNLAFSAARAITEFEGRGSSIWRFINDGIYDGLTFAGCIAERPHVEDEFPEETAECQCAKEGGQLIARIDAGLGAAELRPIGEPLTAKEILETGYTADGAAFCQWKTTGYAINIESVEKLDSWEKFDVEWFIRPMPTTGCCGEAPPEIPYFPIPEPDVIEGTGPGPDYAPCPLEIVHIDSKIDFKGMLWNKYRVQNVEGSTCAVPEDKFCYWESYGGIVIPASCDDPVPFPMHRPLTDCNPGLSAVTYSVSAGCTWNEELQQYDTVYSAPVEATDNGILGLAWRLDAIAWLLEKVNLIPYAVCAPENAPGSEGDYRTISFISDETSPEGNNRLRKRFRYKSSSSVGLSGVVDHWRSFTWQAGPVCVSHKGSALGAPQVWAATAEEGKRVIRHAADEAGLDADQVGRWLVSGSTDPRYGMPGTMRVNTKGGYYWITSRLGPDQRPLVEQTFLDPGVEV